MAYRCTNGNHGSCDACQQFVPSIQRGHTHTFGTKTNRGILCAKCSDITFLAAELILSSVALVGYRFDDAGAFARFARQHVTIGVDLPLFDVGPERRN
jgi:hypothetical protein